MWEGDDWIRGKTWTYAAKDFYEEAWETERGDLLYVRDRLRDGYQTTFDDFQMPRYTVELNRAYAPSDEPTVLDRFEDVDEAAGYIRVLTYPGL